MFCVNKDTKRTKSVHDSVTTLLLLVISALASVLLSYYASPAKPSNNPSAIQNVLKQLPIVGVSPASDPIQYKHYEDYLPAEMEAYEIEHAESQGYVAYRTMIP